ncbi:Double-stranded RNA-binding [Heracleum sosnowskyi]|uniref:Double-stranded RNA-binding n=1 Tax=Heracleum sosnowskyi TaxID=360622 RepID=A0AAD8IPX8_9APIA|nr:Double-stranded RNA-binding [Heracleum sosnowskyi]
MEEITEQFQKLNTGKSVVLGDGEDFEAETSSSLSLEEVEKIIEYSFKNKRLLEEAYTDHSYKKGVEGSYERLEYLGDSILNCVMATQQFDLYPDLPPGELTQLRSANVCTEKLARAAAQHGLYRFLRHNKPMLDAQIEEFVKTEPNYPPSSVGLIDAPKTLANIVESTIGAVYLDSDKCNKTTSKVIEKLLQPIITPSTLARHPVTLLYEICQKNGFSVEVIDSWNKTGQVEIIVANQFVGRGQYNAKKIIAYNRAAADAYNEIVMKLNVNDG